LWWCNGSGNFALTNEAGRSVISTGCPAFLGGFSSNFFKTNDHQVGRPAHHSLRRQYAIEQGGQLFFTTTASPLDDERDNNSRHSDDS